MIRWLVDRRNSKLAQYRDLNPEQMQAAGDRSAGVLLSSGYIAGGALAGIVIAFSAGLLSHVDKALETWALAHNPFFQGSHADALSMIPYLLIAALLYWVGREKNRTAS